MDAFKNAAAHYDSRRKHLTKHEKTVAATDKVVKAAEKRTQQQLAKVGLQPFNSVVVLSVWWCAKNDRCAKNDGCAKDDDCGR